MLSSSFLKYIISNSQTKRVKVVVVVYCHIYFLFITTKIGFSITIKPKREINQTKVYEKVDEEKEKTFVDYFCALF